MAKVKYSFAQWCRDNKHEDWLDLWDCELNNCSPEDISYGSKKKYWFKCKRKIHNSEQKSICVLTDKRRVDVLFCNKCRSFGQYLLDEFGKNGIDLYWSDKNNIDPFAISKYYKNKIFIKCPNCGFEYKNYTYRLIDNHFSCKACGDGFSWGSKFVLSVLRQLKNKCDFNIKSEHVFDWSCKNDEYGEKIYDFYIPLYNAIIEVHGGQHYVRNGFKSTGGRTLEEEQSNDLFKYNLAIKNNIEQERYIVINAMKSDVDWIKTSIMNSTMPILFNFKECDIDWVECSKFASSSLLIECCNLWNSGLRSSFLIGDKLGINEHTAILYLKRGNYIGECIYKSSDLRNLSDRKPIICSENNFIFDSATTCELYSEKIFGCLLYRESIRTVINNKLSLHGYHFKYITKEEFLQIQRSDPSHAFGEVYFYDINDPKGENLTF